MGRGAAVKLAQKGPIVIIAARRKDMLDEVVAEITMAGGAALAVQMDISNATDVSRLAQATLSQFGRIDVWVNNVGIGAIGFFWDIPIKDHARVVDGNLKGLIYGAHVALH